MKNRVFFIIFFLVLNIFSQEKIFKIAHSFDGKQTFFTTDKTAPIVNKTNNNFSLLFVGNKTIQGYLFDENFNKIDSLISKKRPRKFNTIIGSNVTDKNDYYIFLSNKNKNKFAKVKFSYRDKQTSFTELDLSFLELEIDLDDEGENFVDTGEVFLQTINYSNNFYIITFISNTSTLNIYEFDNDNKNKKHTLDFSNYQFYGKKDSIKKMSSLFYNRRAGNDNFLNLKELSISKIEKNSINTIDNTCKYSKIYIQDKYLIFTFDRNINTTQILKINLDNFSNKLLNIDKISKNNSDFKAKKSNSFIFEDKIYQLSSTSSDLFFEIKKISDGSLVNSFHAQKDEPIDFKNTPISRRLKANGFDTKRVLKTTKQFLRKISSSNLGISVTNINNNYQVIIGGYKENSNNQSSGFGINNNSPLAQFSISLDFYNRTLAAYNSYSNSKAVTTTILLDNNFKHIDGDIEKNTFEMIDEFKEKNHYPKTGEIIFKYKNKYILGHFMDFNPFYHFYSFSNE